MAKKIESYIADASAWLTRQDVNFGQIGIVFTIHDGVVVRVERSRIDKTQTVIGPSIKVCK